MSDCGTQLTESGHRPLLTRVDPSDEISELKRPCFSVSVSVSVVVSCLSVTVP